MRLQASQQCHTLRYISDITVPQAMAPAPKKPAAVQAEVALLHSLKNCLVNLPASLVSVLVNANTVSCLLHPHTTLSLTHSL